METKIRQHMTFMYSQNPKKKTADFSVVSNHNNFLLGTIHWHSGWRCYVFEPIENTIYSWDCLKEISEVILEIHKDRLYEKGDGL
jgi:hypothetical protein